MSLDFAVEQVPDAPTLLLFRHPLEERTLGEALFAAQNEVFEAEGLILGGGSIVDATIIAAPSSTQNVTGTRDPQMHQTKKSNQWYFGMKGQRRHRRRHRVRPLGHRDRGERPRLR